jgi:hypothetical protein
MFSDTTGNVSARFSDITRPSWAQRVRFGIWITGLCALEFELRAGSPVIQQCFQVDIRCDEADVSVTFEYAEH